MARVKKRGATNVAPFFCLQEVGKGREQDAEVLAAIRDSPKAPTLGESGHFESQSTSLRINQRLHNKTTGITAMFSMKLIISALFILMFAVASEILF